MTVEDLRGVAAIAFELADEDRLISSSASCAIQRARLSSSAKSSSSVSSVIVGCRSGPRLGPRVIDEDASGFVVAPAESSNLSPGVLSDTETGFDGTGDSVRMAAGAAKLQVEVVKYAGSRLLGSE